jgi:hypothetical protein
MRFVYNKMKAVLVYAEWSKRGQNCFAKTGSPN